MQFLDIDALFLLVVVLLMICTVAIAALFQVRRVSKLPQQVPNAGSTRHVGKERSKECGGRGGGSGRHRAVRDDDLLHL